MSFRGVNAANDTIQVWNGNRWVPLANLAFTETATDSTLTNATGTLTLVATTGTATLQGVGATVQANAGTASVLGAGIIVTAASTSVAITAATTASLTATTGTATLQGVGATVQANAGTASVLGAGVSLAAGSTSVDVTAATNVNVTANAGTGNFNVTAKNTVLSGNLIVNGTTTSVDTQTVLIKDNYINLNTSNTSLTAVPGGMVIDLLATATPASITAFTATTISAAGLSLSPGNFVMVTGSSIPENNGLFEVFSYSDPTITIDTSPTEGFSQTTLTAGTGSGTVSGVQVAAIRAGATGAFQQATGTAAPLTWQPFSVGNETLQQAYDSGTGATAGQIALGAGARGGIVFRNGSNTVDPLHVQVGGSDADVLVVGTAGNVSVTPVGGQNFLAQTSLAGGLNLISGGTGAINMIASGAATTVQGTSLTLGATSANFSLTGATAGQIGVTGGALNIGASGATGTVTMQSESDMTLFTGGASASSANILIRTGVTSTGTDFGDIVIRPSLAGPGNVNGGDLTLSAGIKNGTGTNGALILNGGGGPDTWPATQGTASQVLSTTGSGALVWVSPAAPTTPTLAQVYDAGAVTGNQVTITAADGPIALTTASATNALTSTTSSTGSAMVVSSTGAGDALVLDATGAGNALTVKSTVLTVSGAGGISASATSGQNIQIQTAGAGVLTAQSTGSGNLVLQGTGTGNVSLANTGTGTTTVSTISGAMNLTSGGAATLSAATTMSVTATTSLALNIAGSPGTAGQVLTSNGTNAAWATPAAVIPYTVLVTTLAAETITAASINASEITVACAAITLTVNLPSAATVTTGRRIIIKDAVGKVTPSPATNITINGTSNIDGTTPQFIGTKYGSMTLQSDGTNWMII